MNGRPTQDDSKSDTIIELEINEERFGIEKEEIGAEEEEIGFEKENFRVKKELESHLKEKNFSQRVNRNTVLYNNFVTGKDKRKSEYTNKRENKERLRNNRTTNQSNEMADIEHENSPINDRGVRRAIIKSRKREQRKQCKPKK